VRRQLDADGSGGGGVTNTFYAGYVGISPTLELDGTTKDDVSHRYLWGAAVDQLLADEQVTSTSSDGNTLWPLADHLGTIRDIADYDGGTPAFAITNHRVYDSFGRLESETNSAVDLLFGFTGKQFDEDTGLNYYLNRWYDSRTGKWLSEDPAGFAAGDANLARYVANAPTMYVDPLGLVQAFAQNGAANTTSDGALQDNDKDYLSPPPGVSPRAIRASLSGNELAVGNPFEGNGWWWSVKVFASGYWSNLKTEVISAVKTIESTGRAAGDTVTEHVVRTRHDPQWELDVLTDAALKDGVSFILTGRWIADDPRGFLRALGDALLTYGDQLTSDPKVSGEALGAGAVGWASTGAGGVVVKVAGKVRKGLTLLSRAPTSNTPDVAPAGNFDAEAARYQAYWQGYAPDQVTDGTTRLDWIRVSGRTGRYETSRVIYDEFGRQRYRVDFTDHMRPKAHSNPHLHEYIYGPGYSPYREVIHNLDGR